MDVLVSSHSSLRGASLLPPNHCETNHLLKSPLPYSYLNLSTSKPKPPSTLYSSTKPPSLLSASSTPSPPPPTPTLSNRTHHRAATGYATALIHFSRRGGFAALTAVARDVHRLATAVASILADWSMSDEERAEAVRGAVESGGFDRRLVVLVRMVAAKGRGAEEVADVLEEFGRLWREMTVAAVEEVEVVVASEKKMGIEELAKVAREVQRACGAMHVRMKHLYQRKSSGFAL